VGGVVTHHTSSPFVQQVFSQFYNDDITVYSPPRLFSQVNSHRLDVVLWIASFFYGFFVFYVIFVLYSLRELLNN
jgi:hypothetical protein